MESVSRAPLQRMKHTRGSNASSSSFSIKNPYDGVFLSRGGKAKFEPHEYAEIFSGSSSIPVLDLSGLNGPGGCRSSEIDYSNIFGGAKGEDVEVPYEQVVNGVHRKTKTRIPADAEFQARGSLNSLGKAKRFSGACAQGTEEIKQQFNMSFNKTNQRSGDESNGETHVAQLHAVPGFTHFVDGTPQLHKEEGYRHVPSVKPDVSRTWNFSSGIQEITTKGGLCSEKSHTPVKSWSVNGIHVTSHIPEVQPPLSQPSGPNDNKDIKQSSLPAFGSKETVDGNSPPLFDEELEENSDAAISVAALKKAIQQAQESISLAKMIMQKKGEGVKDVSRARRLKGRSKVEDKKENKTDHAPGGLKKKNLKEEFLRLDPAFNGVEGKSATILTHSDNLHNGAKAKVETVRENFEAANSHGDAFPEIDKTFTSSCCQSESLKNDKNVEVENSRQDVAASEANGETINVTGLATVVLESEKVDSKYDLICSKPKAVPCIEQMGTDRKALKQKQLTNQLESEVFSGRAESVADDSQIVQDLEESSNEAAVEQYQETIGPMKGLVYLTEQFERVLKYSSSMLEQAKITHEGGGYLRSSQETELPEGSETISDGEKCEKKFAGRSELNNLQNESCGLAEKNMMDQEDIDKKLESVCEWKEDGQDGDRRDEDENGMTLNEETLWFESELQLEETMAEEMSEREPVIFPGVGEASNKVDMVLEPRIDVDKVKLEHEEDTRTVPTEHEDGIVNGCVDAAECEEVETLQVETNNYSESQNGEIPLDVEEINDTHRSAGRREEHQVPFEFQGSDSEKDTSDAFDVHSEDSGTIFSDNHGSNTRTILTETKETCDVDFNNTAEKYQAVLRGCEDDNSFLGETESFQKCASIEKFTESHTFESFSSDSKCTSVALTNADNEKASLKDEDVLKTTVEIQNTAQECDANACMQNLSELHGSTDNEVENLDKTNAEPDSQKKSENRGESQSSSNFETMEDISANESPACSEEEAKSDVDMNSDERVHVGQQSECLNSEDQSHLSQENCEVKEMDKSLEAEREIKTGHHMENLSRTSTTEQEDAKRNDQKFDKDDQMQRIEAIKRGRAREKDRIAAERVIREARERAFAEARERAERAAVERAAAEARQRVMEEVREKTGKASVETKPSADKASIEAKRRAERAAVERATAEARERAQKAMSQKTSMEARVQSAKYSTEQFPSSSRNNGLKHSFSSSDLEKVGGATSESALRSKARLERHERIMERAAKALAEKNSRDLLAQKEQAERNRLAESVDADIKRWATGKQGNLRALLSTLQYILGPDSGWQPVTLTEIVTAAAVKKAYRKATLCVHPDKLQQRGATIQQKYTCEKIFDLLKAAWNKFNSEER